MCMLQHRGTSWGIPPDPRRPWSCTFYNQWWYCPWFQQRQNQDGGFSKFARTILQIACSRHTIFCVAKEQWSLPPISLKNNEASHPYPSWALCMSLSWGSVVNTCTCGSLHTCKQSHQASLQVEKGEYETYPLSKFHARPQIQVLVESCLLLIFWKNTEFSSLSRTVRSLVSVGRASWLC